MYLFLFCLLLVFDHLLQLVIGSSVLCLQLLALNSQVTTKLLYLDEDAQVKSWGQTRAGSSWQAVTKMTERHIK